jgi:hypothetical protein
VTKRKAPPTRAIPRGYPTRATERAADAGKRYAVHRDGPRDANGHLGFDMVHGILDRETGQFDTRPGMTRSQVYAEVVRLNAGLPVSRESQGIGRKPRVVPEAALWVEFLMDVDGTQAQLEGAVAEGRKLSRDDVRELMLSTYCDIETGEPFHKFPSLQLPTAENAQRKLIDAVWKQLERALGLRREMSRGTGSRLNAVRQSKRRDAAHVRAQAGIDAEHHEWMQRAARKGKR